LRKTILLTGATGLIGKKLITSLINKGYSVKITSRRKEYAERTLPKESVIIEWDYSKSTEEIKGALEGCFSVINLAGASIAGKRWNDEYKKLIYDSRVLTTKKLTEAISECSVKPESLISTSASGYYGFDGEETLTENSSSGSDYLAGVCRDWENAAYGAEKYGVRVVSMRVAVVLDKNEGALQKILTPYKFFAGGHLGSGKQWFPWIHADDLVNMYIFALENKIIKGGLNCVAPEQVRNKEFSKALGKAINRPVLFSVPGFMLKAVTGEFAHYLLKGRRLYPEKALANGFKFEFNNIEKAFKNIFNENN
jgi:uncharacterized protein (TIGR01777 family)